MQALERPYRTFCHSVLGKFIDHVPSEEPGRAVAAAKAARIEEQVVQEPHADVERLAVATLQPKLFDKYSKTIETYTLLVGQPPDPTIWPSPSVFRGQDPKPCDGAGGCKPQPACGCDTPRGPFPVPNCRRG